MKFPCLVRPQFCNTPVTVVIYGEGIDEDGAPEIIYSGEHKCNYQDKAKTVLTAEKKAVQVSGVALIPGDIAPDLPTLSGGYVEIFGVRRDIAQGVKARNPDGTVNFIELDVI